jgi:hypothetical protein
MEIRILKSQDLQLLDDFLSTLNEEMYDVSQSEKEAWAWYRSILEQNHRGLILCASINEGKILTIACNFVVDLLYNYKTRHFPYWVVGLVRSIDITNNIPNDKIDSLVTPAIRVLEKQGYKTIYIVREVPSSLGYHNIVPYIQRVINKNFKVERYNTFLDRFIEDPTNYKEFDVIRHIIPKKVSAGKKIAIFRLELMYEYCDSANN